MFAIIGAGTIFRLGKQKLVKDNQIQSITLCNMYFSKKVYAMQNGVWGIFENFCVKSNLTICKVTFSCKLQKRLGEQDVLVAPPVPAPMFAKLS